MVAGGYTIKAVLFDFDGTLTQPGALDFEAIKAMLGCPPHLPVLEYIHAMQDALARQTALARLDQFEIEGAQRARPNAGAQEVVAWVKAHHMPVAVITRNSRKAVLRALENFDALGAADFDFILSRDDPPAVKPSGAGIVWAARQWHITPAEILTVGDYVFDPQAGLAAGALTVLLDPGHDPRLADVTCHFRIAGLVELPQIIQAGGDVEDKRLL
jgi:hydrogenase expression/formation protein HypE